MTTTAVPQAFARTGREIRVILLGVMLAMLLAMLDNAIVGTAMPTIVRDLGGLDHMAWVVTAYTLMTAISTPVWGKLGDLFSRKTVFLTSIAVFLVGSLLSGAAWSMTALIGFRALQGLGAGGLMVGAFSIIGALVPPRERGRYQGMTAAVMAIGTIGGPLLGGMVADQLSWRWAFYLNLPLGLLAFGWSAMLLDLPATRRKVTIDYAGIGALAMTIGALVLAATWGGVQYAWTSGPIRGLAALAITGATMFVLAERRAADPVIPLRMFASRNFTLASALSLVTGVVMFAGVLYLPLFQQTVQDASASSSGLLLLPMMIPILFTTQLVGRVMSGTGRYKIFPVLGGVALTAGAVWLSAVDAGTGRLATGAAMALLGLGLGLTMQLTVTIAQNSVDMTDIGAASGTVTLFRTIGGSLGIAAFGAIFTRSLDGRTPAAGPAYLDAVAHGTAKIFLAVAAVSATWLTISWLITEHPLRTAPASKPDERPAPIPMTQSAR
ncbi:MDR family MFS transporter [Actinomadura decatromicini]|uniref:MFS transporter n=1 Tax=Actinomadura decatromicini TaxID=2604572 RepID=A0A5D3F761_9ACTN|nr:MDR family MFS transporter [Actinomadura decatromicini]TYK43175.1 MFS transporter [Actinomadura decatromicini]